MFVRGFGRIGRPGLLGTVARTAVVAGTATAVSGGIIRHQQRRRAEEAEADAYEQRSDAQQSAQSQPQSQPAQAPPSGSPDWIVGQLKELGDLKERGLLTDAEFESQKARLLAQ